MKQFITIQLVLSILLFNINNKIEKNVFVPIPGNDSQFTQQVKSEENYQESSADIEKAYIEIPDQHIRVKYFDLCGIPGTEKCKLKVQINSSIETAFTLDKDSGDEIIKEGKLILGQNDTFIPYAEEFIKKNKHEYVLNFKYNGNEQRIKITLSLEYDGWSEDKFSFEPQTGKISLKLKSEGQKVIKSKSKFVINRKTIIKSGLPKILLGAIILLISPQIDRLREKTKAQPIRTSIESSKRVFNTLGVGFTAYGLSSIFRALKKNKLKGEFLETNDEAMTYNKNLKEEYLFNEREWKDRITVTVMVHSVKQILK